MGRKLDLSFTSEELERYLGEQRTIRIATVSEDWAPHVVPLWFVWVDGSVYLNSTLGNVTVENMLRGGTVAGVVDDGVSYDELRGVVVRGRVDLVEDGDVVDAADRSWSQKYFAGSPTPYGRWRDRVWLRLRPEEVTSWDFRKIPEARARRDAERGRGG